FWFRGSSGYVLAGASSNEFRAAPARTGGRPGSAGGAPAAHGGAAAEVWRTRRADLGLGPPGGAARGGAAERRGRRGRRPRGALIAAPSAGPDGAGAPAGKGSQSPRAFQSSAAAGLAAAMAGAVLGLVGLRRRRTSERVKGELRKWEGADLKLLAICLGIGWTIRYVVPIPDGVEEKGWSMLAIFVAMICGVVLGPLPPAPTTLVALAVALLTKTVTFAEGLTAFTDEGFEPVKKDIQALTTKVDDHTKRIEKLESASRSPGADASSSVGLGNQQASKGFIPTFFNIENFSTYDDRKTLGVSRLEAEEFLSRLKEKLPQSLQEKVGDFECFGSKSNKIKVHVQHPYAVEISLIFKDFLQDEDFKYKGRSLWTAVERSPLEQVKYEKVGKAKAYLTKKTQSKDPNTFASCSYSPHWILTCISKGNGKEVEMGVVDGNGDVTWDEVNVKAAFGITGEQMNKHPSIDFHVVVGTDANVQFSENFESIAGDAVYRDREALEVYKIKSLSFLEAQLPTAQESVREFRRARKKMRRQLNEKKLAAINCDRLAHPLPMWLEVDGELTGAEPSDRFPIFAGGKQGGIETPPLFNYLIEFIMQPVVDKWRADGRGFKFGDDDSEAMSHFVWADNMFLLAGSVVEFQLMAQNVTDAMYKHGLTWKASSLEVLGCGPSKDSDWDDICVFVPEPLVFKREASMQALGVRLSADGVGILPAAAESPAYRDGAEGLPGRGRNPAE
ncbi:unnamed protein product, partial [Prorocentrum cordatum]